MEVHSQVVISQMRVNGYIINELFSTIIFQKILPLFLERNFGKCEALLYILAISLLLQEARLEKLLLFQKGLMRVSCTHVLSNLE